MHVIWDLDCHNIPVNLTKWYFGLGPFGMQSSVYQSILFCDLQFHDTLQT